MANPEHIAILKQGVEAWNAWREENPDITPDLERITLYGWNLRGANLSRTELTYAMLHRCFLERANLEEAEIHNADLSATDFTEATLVKANLCESILGAQDVEHARGGGHGYGRASFYKANLTGAHLCGANIYHGCLVKANLRGADLRRANLAFAELEGCDLSSAILDRTIFVGCRLKGVKGLDTCEHWGPSTIDHLTMQQSGDLPLSFLRGCGLPESLIEYLPSILNKPIQFYTCFISYSHKDEEFAQRLHAALQNKGVRCWFASEKMKIGDKILDTIDSAIRGRDKLLIILSENSVKSDWVKIEVETALEEEGNRKQTVLFPIRIDDTVMESREAWAARIRSRHIGDFTNWKDRDSYRKAFERLMRDLGTEGQNSEQDE